MDIESKTPDYKAYLIDSPLPQMGADPILSWNPDPLYSEITPNLFQGGTAETDTIHHAWPKGEPRDRMPFDAVISMYYAARPAEWSLPELRHPIKDGEISDIDLDELKHVIIWGKRHMLEGHKVLVRCQAGLNRSGFVVSLLLMSTGYTAPDAIALIRSKRSKWALYNEHYVRWLIEEGSDFITSLG